MSKKRNKNVKLKPRRRKSYAQKHPPAKKGLPPVKVEAEDNVSKIVTIGTVANYQNKYSKLIPSVL